MEGARAHVGRTRKQLLHLHLTVFFFFVKSAVSSTITAGKPSLVTYFAPFTSPSLSVNTVPVYLHWVLQSSKNVMDYLFCLLHVSANVSQSTQSCKHALCVVTKGTCTTLILGPGLGFLFCEFVVPTVIRT